MPDQRAGEGRLRVGRPCDECGDPVPSLEEWQQVVEGGAGLARGHRSCIEAEWGRSQMATLKPSDLTSEQRHDALVRAAVMMALALGESRVDELADKSQERGHADTACMLRWLIQPNPADTGVEPEYEYGPR